MRVIIVGASSGIGKSLAFKFAEKGHKVAICARRENLLKEMQSKADFLYRKIDVANYHESIKVVDELIIEMGGVDVVVLNAGVLIHEKDWESEVKTCQINAIGFMALANHLFEHFDNTNGGIITGLSSIAALKGFAENPAYCASKSFISTYMQSLSQKSHILKNKIHIVEVIAGFVHSDMTAKRKLKIWCCSSEYASKLIYNGIVKKKRKIYVSRRWIFVAFLIKIVPSFIFERIPLQLENTYHE